MGHIVLSILIIGGYVGLLAAGVDNDTMQFAVVGVLGYWFGISSGVKMKKPTKRREGGEGEQ